jgi:TrmH family RNA methyltransferase
VISGLKLISEVGKAFVIKTLVIGEGVEIPLGIRFETLQRVKSSLLKQITGLEQPELYAAEVEAPKEQDVSSCKKLLVLDQVADPGNLGTLLRTALGLRWDGVFCVRGCVDLFNDKALRAAKGATFFLPFQLGSYEELSVLLKNRTCFVAEACGREVEKGMGEGCIALVLGNEAHGVGEAFANFPKVGIPLHEKMESLNVAVAGAILMDQLRHA